MTDPRRRVPRTDALLADPRLAEAERVLGRALVKSVIAAAQQAARAGEIAPERVADHAVAALPGTASSLRPVLNATGVIIGSQGRGARNAGPFPHPPFNPCVRFSRTRLTDDLLDMVTLPSGSGWCREAGAGRAR